VRAGDDLRDDPRWFGDGWRSTSMALPWTMRAFVAGERSTPLSASIHLSPYPARRHLRSTSRSLRLLHLRRTESWSAVRAVCRHRQRMVRHPVYVASRLGV
jgi:hypothetical protein